MKYVAKAYFTVEVQSSLGNLPLNYSGGLAKLVSNTWFEFDLDTAYVVCISVSLGFPYMVSISLGFSLYGNELTATTGCQSIDNLLDFNMICCIFLSNNSIYIYIDATAGWRQSLWYSTNARGFGPWSP